METNRMEELVEIINKLNFEYYSLDNPSVDDEVWDALYNELLTLEKETGKVLPNSPTQRVGDKVLNSFEKHKHLAPLFSLDKANSIGEIENFANKIEDDSFMIEFKYDGLTLNLTYDGGLLVSASTRGNGAFGEEILAQVKTIKSIPLQIPFKGKMEVQGEGIMRKSVLKEYNKTAKEPLKNERNAAAGALRNLDTKVTAQRKLDCFCYNVGYIEGKEFNNAYEMIDFLIENGFPVGEVYRNIKGSENIAKVVEEITAKRNDLDFLIDGIVIKVDDYKKRESLGYTQKFPKWALAYKFEATKVTTKVIKVDWNVGRTGKVTPVATLEPVDIDGVTVRHATLNNYENIQKKKVAIGSDVILRRSNDVIPEILISLNDGEHKILPPVICPSCGNLLISVGPNFFCLNSIACKPQIIGKLANFVSRDAMDIVGLSEKTLETLYDNLNVRIPSDLYRITKEELLTLEGFKDKKALNTIEAIQKSKSPNLSEFIYSLSIPNVGKKTAIDLANTYKNFEAFKNAELEELVEIDDVGLIVASCILDFLGDYGLPIMDGLINAGVIPKEVGEISDEQSPLRDKKIVITGTLSMGRNEFKKMLEEKGAIIQNAVAKSTDMLVYGENAGSKLAKAKELNLAVFNEKEFMNEYKFNLN